MSVGAIRAGQAFVELATRNNKLIQGLNDASRRLKNFGANVAAVGRRMATFGIGAAVPLGLAVRRFMEFDDQMRLLRAVSEGTEAEFQTLVTRAKELGLTSGFAATQVAALMVELGKAGFTRREINDATTSILNLARAVGEDVEIVSKIVGQALRQFGLASNQATHVADLLVVAANRSIASVESLGEALQYTGPIAAQFNLSIEDTLAILAALGNIGILGSNAGTALRRLLTLTGTQAAELQRLFGVSGVDAAGNARNVADILAEIDDALRGMGTAERSQKLFEFFGFLGITAARGIGANIGNVRELQEALRNAGGAAAETARQMDAGIGGAWRRFLAMIESIGLAIGEALEGPLTVIGEVLRGIGMGIRDWIRENRDLVAALSGTIAFVIGLGAGLIALGVAIKIVGFALGAVGAVLAIVKGAFALVLSLVIGLLSPLGILVTTITAGALAWSMFTDSGRQGTLDLTNSIHSLGRIFSETWAGIMEAMRQGDLQGAMEIAMTGMRAAWATGIAGLKSVWREFRDWVIDTFWSVVYAIARGFIHVFNSINRHFLMLIRTMNEMASPLGLNVLSDEGMTALEQHFAGMGGGMIDNLNRMQEEERRVREQQRMAEREGDMAEARRLQRELERLRRDQQRVQKQPSAWWKPPRAGLAPGGPGGTPQVGLGNIDVFGTFSGAAASLLGVGASIQNVRDEGVRNELRGLRNDVQERGGINVV